ncbi:hypothetical protein NDU88_007355 [Pleurodeles waltl]|uniref:Zinc finger CCHC domain-containing protein n=1 Tax=Pleurodeles waltl TaxID=8319 RepID=A0AAV7SSA7_PLEWA|nr:hypothetical protein NDU88_007355 [Pleurodeles waltl]
MSRPLNPWFHNTVKLQRKVESDGSTPELSRKTFTELLVTKMGFTAAEIWCIMFDAPKGTYLLTFMSEQICRRYWQMCWSRRDEKPFSDLHLECQLVMEDDCARLQPAGQHPGPDRLPTPPLHSDERTLPQPGQ